MGKLLIDKLFKDINNDEGHMQLLVSEALCMTPSSLVEKMEDATLSAVTRLYTSMGNFFIRNAPVDDDGYDYEAEIKRGLADMNTRVSARVAQQFAAFADGPLSQILSIDTEITRDGFFRLRQNEGIDYVDPEKASKLADEVIRCEDALASSYRRKKALRFVLKDLEDTEAELEEVLDKLGDNLDARILRLREEHAETRDLAASCAASMVHRRRTSTGTPLDDWELENEGEIHIRLA